MTFGPATCGLGLIAGALSTLSPCVLPLVPIVLASALSAHRWGAMALGLGPAPARVVCESDRQIRQFRQSIACKDDDRMGLLSEQTIRCKRGFWTNRRNGSACQHANIDDQSERLTHSYESNEPKSLLRQHSVAV